MDNQIPRCLLHPPSRVQSAEQSFQQSVYYPSPPRSGETWQSPPSTSSRPTATGRLEAVVDRDADKDAAGIGANSVPNVFAATTNLRVQKGNLAEASLSPAATKSPQPPATYWAAQDVAASQQR
ncbi:MAG: hypothetical protein ABSA57_16450 [Candidatus Acidiferrales bacterium]